jgi:hypothetical protein
MQNSLVLNSLETPKTPSLFFSTAANLFAATRAENFAHETFLLF